MDVRVGLWRRLSTEELMLLNCRVGEDSWEPLGQQGDPTSPFSRKSTLKTDAELEAPILWPPDVKSWRLWCWQRLKAGEGDDRGWDGWMASLIQWTWVRVNSGSWWWDRGAWRAAVYGVTKRWTRLSNWNELNCAHLYHILEISTLGFPSGFSVSKEYFGIKSDGLGLYIKARLSSDKPREPQFPRTNPTSTKQGIPIWEKILFKISLVIFIAL